MTQEDKELLLKNLCARLPYGVIVEDRNGTHELTIGNTELADLLNGNCHIKPYLRTMSNMTEEERKEFIDAVTWETDGKFYIDECEDITFYQEKYDWLNAHHFDYIRDKEGKSFIELGLALEAPEGMYIVEKQL